ncbi:MAG: cob(I)yrinic acid a,c-diamide adenosyltransferase [Candidatus Nanoarchaeia archaeon]
MGIVTKRGDKGKTSLCGCTGCSKDDPRVDAYGAVDELNSAIGVALNSCSNESMEVLELVQNQLFVVGAVIAGSEKHSVDDTHIIYLENEIKKAEDALPLQNGFILPKGKGAALHLARTICRRAERRAVASKQSENVLAYLNRLSDLLFILARKESGKDEEVKY